MKIARIFSVAVVCFMAVIMLGGFKNVEVVRADEIAEDLRLSAEEAICPYGDVFFVVGEKTVSKYRVTENGNVLVRTIIYDPETESICYTKLPGDLLGGDFECFTISNDVKIIDLTTAS